jgi:hypothetical protein
LISTRKRERKGGRREKGKEGRKGRREGGK